VDTRHLIHQFADPAAYPHPADPVTVLQTHISVVFLAGPFAYKLKKPVRLGFLDFSTPDRRRHFCEEEVRLNRRLAPHVYLGVVPVTHEKGQLRIDGTGETIDWAVKMVRLPEDGSLLACVERGEVTPADLSRLAQFLAAFHRSAETSDHIAAFGRFDVVAANARENFTQSEPHVGTTLSRTTFDRLRALTDAALDRLRPLIENRAARGVPRDTHGDLHLDHVFLPPDGEPFAIDCIEFNERFRFADPVADLAFLVMDLKFRGRADLAAVLADAYFREANDEDGWPLLAFYTAYRAAVRAKVEGFELAEAEVPQDEQAAAAERAKAHWLLALGELEEPGKRPALVLVGGLPGTGKSTLSRELAAVAGFDVVRSDVVRKELAGVSSQTPMGGAIYTPEWNDRTYAECLRRADALLFEGRRVIVDATFRQDSRRRAFVDLARRRCVPAALFVCEASPEVVRDRLAARTGDASDAGWEVYRAAAGAWEPASFGVSPVLISVQTDPGLNPTESAVRTLRERGLMG
jgi:aminoglycoside phosphotransferase family enzyme/predicted kinase